MGRSDAQLADKYAMNKPGDQDHYMLLAKFSQGRRAAGRLRGDIEPGFDSRVDNLDSPKIFVAPSAMQVKPIAIIRYSNNSTAAAGFNVRRASGATVPGQSPYVPAPLPTPPYVQPTLPVQHDTLGVGGGARGGRPLHGSQDPLPEMLRDKAAAQGKAAAVYKAAEEVAEAKMDNGVRINPAFRRRHERAEEGEGEARQTALSPAVPAAVPSGGGELGGTAPFGGGAVAGDSFHAGGGVMGGGYAGGGMMGGGLYGGGGGGGGGYGGAGMSSGGGGDSGQPGGGAGPFGAGGGQPVGGNATPFGGGQPGAGGYGGGMTGGGYNGARGVGNFGGGGA